MITQKAPLVDGVPRPTGVVRDIINPWNGEVVSRVEDADAATVEAAITTAARGAAILAELPSHRRAEILENAAGILTKRAEETARILVQESGKPIRDARAEVARCIVTLKTSAEESKRLAGEYLPFDAVPAGVGRAGITRRVPIGIVTAVSPFNFPLNLPAHKVAPALACGNSILLKPAPRTPGPAFELINILLEAGCPPAALSVIPGDPPAIDPLITDPRIAMISFTGSAAVGWKMKERAGKKKVVLELGGNAPAIVHEDADLELAATRCVAGSFTYAGQVCIRSQRIYVHKSAREKFMHLFLQKTAALRIGDPMLESTDFGPMIDAASASRAWSWVEESLAFGAKLISGGPPKGALLPPAIVWNAPANCKVSSEEIFAPAVAVEEYEDFDRALELVNNSRYGLQAGVFTNSVNLLFKAFERINAGAVIHNDTPMFRVDTMPYGGVKDSGFGREGVRHSMIEMTELKMLVIRADR